MTSEKSERLSSTAKGTFPFYILFLIFFFFVFLQSRTTLRTLSNNVSNSNSKYTPFSNNWYLIFPKSKLNCNRYAGLFFLPLCHSEKVNFIWKNVTFTGDICTPFSMFFKILRTSSIVSVVKEIQWVALLHTEISRKRKT